MALNDFTMSFTNGIIRLLDKQYTSIGSMSGSQSIDRAGVYGTGRTPQGMSQGQVGLGEGSVTFNDLVEAHQFMADLRAVSADPSLAIFSAEYTATDASGNTVSYEMIGCALSENSFEFENGSDALTREYPFHFLRMKQDNAETAL